MKQYRSSEQLRQYWREQKRRQRSGASGTQTDQSGQIVQRQNKPRNAIQEVNDMVDSWLH